MIHPDRLRMMGRPDQPKVPSAMSHVDTSNSHSPSPAPIQQLQSFEPHVQGVPTSYGYQAPAYAAPYVAPYANPIIPPTTASPYVQAPYVNQPQFPPPIFQQPQQFFPKPAQAAAAAPWAAPAAADQEGRSTAVSSAERKVPKTIGDWTMYESPEGKPYYFNNKTQMTTWDSPSEFLAAAVSPAAPVVDEWATFYTPEGKPYYYNSRSGQTVWEKPVQARPAQTPLEQPQSAEIVEEPEQKTSDESPPAENVEIDPLLAVPYKPFASKDYATREEAVAAFCALLTSSGVSSTSSWELALPKIVHDKRYRALPTLSERKDAFKQWCIDYAEVERSEIKRQAQEKRAKFLELLSEHKAMIHPRVRYVEIEPLIRLDPRHSAVDTRDREDLFYSFVDGVLEQERKAKIAMRQEHEAAFLKFLTSSSNITVKTQWRTLLDSIRDEPVYKSLDPADALKVFESLLSDLKREDDKRLLAEKEAAREAEKQRRADYRALLLENMNQGTLHLRTRWRTFCETIRDDPRFIALSEDAKFNGQTLFDDFCDELEDRVLPSRKKLKEAMVASNIDVIRDMDTVEGLVSQLGNAEALQGVPDIHVCVLLSEYIDHAQSKAAHASKRLEKYTGLFVKLLTKKVRKPLPWESVIPLLESHSAYKKLDENVRLDIFKKHLEMLSAPGHENSADGVETDDTDGEIEEEPPKKRVSRRSSSFDSRSRRKRSRSQPRRRRASRSPLRKSSPSRRVKRSRSISVSRRRRDRSPARRRR